MAAVALVIALGALGAVPVPRWGKFAALGLGLFAVAVAEVARRRRGAPSRQRLVAAAGATLGVVALVLGGLKVALTLLAIDRLAGLLGS